LERAEQIVTRALLGDLLTTETLYRRDATPIPVEFCRAPLIVSEQIIGTVITITDLTERRRAQAAITRLELIAASVDEAIIIHTPDGIITSWNQAAERIYGYVEEEVVGRHVSIIHPPGYKHELKALFETVLKQEKVDAFETVRIRKGGERVYVWINAVPLSDGSGSPTCVAQIVSDLTERKRAEEALRQSVSERRRAEETLRENEAQLRLANEKLETVVQKRTASLRHLSAKLMRSQDEEHRRIARNLHDSLGQYLASIKMNLELLSHSDTPNKDEVLSSTLESVERSIAETRTLSCLLHPPLLDEVGFASAARWYTDEFAKRSGIKVKLDLPEELERLPELEGIALFRILQESLTNVHRHSGSSSVEIGLSVTENQVVLSVRDFGRGMPAGLRQSSDQNGNHVGVGLSGMRERATDLGGRFDIESNSCGTAIIVALPLGAHSRESRPSQGSLRKNFAA